MIPRLGTQTSALPAASRTPGEETRAHSPVTFPRTSSLTSMAPDLSDHSTFWFCPGVKPIVFFLQHVRDLITGETNFAADSAIRTLPAILCGLITMPVWAPAGMVCGLVKGSYLYVMKQITYFRAKNMNEDEKRLMDVAFALKRPFNEESWNRPYNPFLGRGLDGFDFINRSLQEELREKLLGKEHQVKRPLQSVRELISPTWLYNTWNECNGKRKTVAYFIDALDELIEEKINRSRVSY